MEEIWKKFGNIEVSNLGRVKTPRFKDGSYTGCYSRKGYKEVGVKIDSTFKTIKLHRIVAHVFLDFDLNSNMQINHINCNRDDNRVENLEIVDQLENMQKSKHHTMGRLWGCYFDKRWNLKKPWKSQIHINGKNKNLGCYVTERLAHMVAVANYIDYYGKPPHCTCDYCN